MIVNLFTKIYIIFFIYPGAWDVGGRESVVDREKGDILEYKYFSTSVKAIFGVDGESMEYQKTLFFIHQIEP